MTVLRKQEASMNHGIYIAGAEPRSGKSAIVLGMMDMLSGKMGKIGFFRPVVRDGMIPDNLTSLIIRRYTPGMPYEKMYGCTNEAAREILLNNGHEDLLKHILEK